MWWHTAFAVSLYAIAIFPSTHAWSLTWTKPDGEPVVEPGEWSYLAHPCKEINNQAGDWFEFDGQDDPVTLYLYTNRDCSGTPMGEAEFALAKNATYTIRSYKVVDRSKTTMTTTTSEPATSTTSSTTTSTPSTTSPASKIPETISPSPSSSSSLSAGEIAGIVVGIVIGLGLIGAIIYLARQRGRAAAPSTAQFTPATPPSAPPPVSPAPQSPEEGLEPYVPKIAATGPEKMEPPVIVAKQGRFAELVGDTGTAELSDTRRLNEMEASTKTPYS